MDMTPQPQAEHRWLEQLLGEWTFESEGIMGPDQPPMITTGSEVVRSLGGLWTIGEGVGGTPEAGWASIMTLGFDTRTGRFVGTFIASMMTHLWIYDGSLDSTKRILTLDAEGPGFTGDKLCKYQDMMEILDKNNRVLSSKVLQDDGTWLSFMKAHYRRKA